MEVAAQSTSIPNKHFEQVEMDVAIPTGTKSIKLSGGPDGTSGTSADDKVVIQGPDGTTLFSCDYRIPNGGIQELSAIDVFNAPSNPPGFTGVISGSGFASLVGQTSEISLKCIDLQGNSRGCTNMWLVCS